MSSIASCHCLNSFALPDTSSTARSRVPLSQPSVISAANAPPAASPPTPALPGIGAALLSLPLPLALPSAAPPAVSPALAGVRCAAFFASLDEQETASSSEPPNESPSHASERVMLAWFYDSRSLAKAHARRREPPGTSGVRDDEPARSRPPA